MSVCKRVLRDAKLELDEIEHVVLVGGSTRSYAVQKAVRELFEREPFCTINPDEVLQLAHLLPPTSSLATVKMVHYYLMSRHFLLV